MCVCVCVNAGDGCIYSSYLNDYENTGGKRPKPWTTFMCVCVCVTCVGLFCVDNIFTFCLSGPHTKIWPTLVFKMWATCQSNRFWPTGVWRLVHIMDTQMWVTVSMGETCPRCGLHCHLFVLVWVMSQFLGFFFLFINNRVFCLSISSCLIFFCFLFNLILFFTVW